MHLSVHTLQNLLDTYGYLAVLVFVAIESTGIPFPGETMLITAAIYAGTGHLRIQYVVAAAIVGAIMGDNFGYLIGRTGGRAVALRWGKYVRLDATKLKTAENFFAKHGDKTVFLGRFIAVLRAWAAFLAGVNRMPWPKFLVFNAAGGICWATLYGTLAFKLGENFERIRSWLGWGILLGVVVGIAVAYLVYRRISRRVAPASAADHTRNEFEPGQPMLPPGSGDSEQGVRT